MITFKNIRTPDEGIRTLANVLAAHLDGGEQVLWLIAGGSNIPIAARIMAELRAQIAPGSLARLVISQTDERYGPVGHIDSNWKQLIDTGVDLDGIRCIPVLRGRSLDETVAEWSGEIEKAFNEADASIGQFGMGADGHIAGILPHSPCIHDPRPVSSHVDAKFTRITLTSTMLERLTSAYAFIQGDTKKEALDDLRLKTLPLDDQPAQILKSIPDAIVYVV